MVRRGRETFITSTMRMKGHGHRKYAWWVTEWRAWLCSSFCPLSWRCRSVSLIVCFWGARFRVQSLRVGLMYIIPTFLAHARNPRPHTPKISNRKPVCTCAQPFRPRCSLAFRFGHRFFDAYCFLGFVCGLYFKGFERV